ncbi:MAG: DUF2306 domain-containing protein [Spirochaetia bacterium]|nr:DUF2306 domain-containing protein [Spirochaetia bacterium]
MNRKTQNITLYTGLALSALLAVFIAFKYIYLLLVPDAESLMLHASETERKFFYHFYGWLMEARLSFLFHIIFGSTALLIGFVQLLILPSEHRKTHQIFGSLYFLSVLLSASGGMIIAGDALGGIPARAGFTFAGVFWLGTLLISGWMLGTSNFKKHGVWIKLNFSLTFAAVTLRLEQPLLILSGMGPEIAYQIVSWMCWIPNFIFALVFLKPVKSNIFTIKEAAVIFFVMTAAGIFAAGRLFL